MSVEIQVRQGSVLMGFEKRNLILDNEVFVPEPGDRLDVWFSNWMITLSPVRHGTYASYHERLSIWRGVGVKTPTVPGGNTMNNPEWYECFVRQAKVAAKEFVVLYGRDVGSEYELYRRGQDSVTNGAWMCTESGIRFFVT